MCRNTIDGVSFIYEVFLSISDRIVRENHRATGEPFVEGGRFDERKTLRNMYYRYLNVKKIENYEQTFEIHKSKFNSDSRRICAYRFFACEPTERNAKPDRRYSYSVGRNSC